MRRINFQEGGEFALDDLEEWEKLLIAPGQIVEVNAFPNLLLAGFLVMKVEFGVEGDMVVHAKSLGCDDSEATRKLSGLFNRRAGTLHMCHSSPCEVAGDFTFHVASLRLFTPEGFARET